MKEKKEWERLNLRVEREVADQLYELADEMEMTLSQFVRKMIKTNLERLK